MTMMVPTPTLSLLMDNDNDHPQLQFPLMTMTLSHTILIPAPVSTPFNSLSFIFIFSTSALLKTPSPALPNYATMAPPASVSLNDDCNGCHPQPCPMSMSPQPQYINANMPPLAAFFFFDSFSLIRSDDDPSPSHVDKPSTPSLLSMEHTTSPNIDDANSHQHPQHSASVMTTPWLPCIDANVLSK